MKPAVDVRGVVEERVNSGARIVTERGQLEQLEADASRGMVIAAVNDIIHSRAALTDIGKHHVGKLMAKIVGDHGPENPGHREPAVLMGPGYFGPNHYLREMAGEFDWPAIWHPEFEGLRPRGRISEDALKYFRLLEKRQAPTIMVGHSRGGPTLLNALAHLQDFDLDDKVVAVVLISPISSGVRDEIAWASQVLPSNTVGEMRPGSGVLRSWERLNAKNRAKVVVINGLHGDQFTSAGNGFVEGGTLVVTAGHDGHIQQVVDRESETFGVVQDIVGGVIERVERV